MRKYRRVPLLECRVMGQNGIMYQDGSYVRTMMIMTVLHSFFYYKNECYLLCDSFLLKPNVYVVTKRKDSYLDERLKRTSREKRDTVRLKTLHFTFFGAKINRRSVRLFDTRQLSTLVDVGRLFANKASALGFFDLIRCPSSK